MVWYLLFFKVFEDKSYKIVDRKGVILESRMDDKY